MKPALSLASWKKLRLRRRVAVKTLSRLWRFFPPPLRYLAIWILHPKVIIGVSGVILNRQNQVLLLRHRFHPEHPWGLPGGLLMRGESLAEGWKREVWEETRLEVVPESIVDQRAMWATQEFILAGRLSGGCLELDPVEILEADFFDAESLPKGIRRHHRAAIRRAIEGRADLQILP